MSDCANAQSGYPPITGELRRAFRATCAVMDINDGIIDQRLTIDQSELNTLCDAIDSIHARLEAENDRLKAEGGHAFAPESHYVMLPKDADGVPIHVGDEVTCVDWQGEHHAVRSITLEADGWWVYVSSMGRRPERFRHHRAPNVVDVLCELLNEYRDGGCALDESRLSEFADRLQLREEA